jgi:hypothetical protein
MAGVMHGSLEKHTLTNRDATFIDLTSKFAIALMERSLNQTATP